MISVSIYRSDGKGFGNNQNDDNVLLYMDVVNRSFDFLKDFIKENVDIKTFGLSVEDDYLSLSIYYDLKNHFSKIDNTLKDINK